MHLDFPRFVEDLVHEGAAAAGTDALTYLSALVCEDSFKRNGEKTSASRLPKIDPAERKRALRIVLEQRAKRLSRERILPLNGRDRP